MKQEEGWWRWASDSRAPRIIVKPAEMCDQSSESFHMSPHVYAC